MTTTHRDKADATRFRRLLAFIRKTGQVCITAPAGGLDANLLWGPSDEWRNKRNRLRAPTLGKLLSQALGEVA